MLKIYITRHGQTEWNTEGRMQGWADSPLTKNGIEDAKLLSERLKCIQFEAIYTSSSGRAFDTAAIIRGQKVETSIIKDDRIKEMNVGIWEGQSKDVLKEKYPVEYAAFWETPHLFKPIDGESFQDVQSRIKLFLEELKKNHQSGNVLIVTHSCALRMMLAYFKKTSIDKLWDTPRIGNTSLSIAEIADDGTMVLRLEGDDSHLIVKKNK